MNRRQFLQRSPGRSLTDRYIRIVRNSGLAQGGIDHAHGQAHSDQREEHRDLRFVERMGCVITRDHRRRGCQRIVFTENCIGRRNGRLADGGAVVHITEIDDAHGLARMRRRFIHQNVVVVGVPVD